MGDKWREVQVHECRWSAGAKAGPKWKRRAAAVAPNRTAFTSVVADLAAAEAPSKISDLHRAPRWTFGLLSTWVGGRDAWQRGPEVKDAGREGRCQKPKGATAVTSGSGTVLAARKERRAAWWRRGQGGGRRPELERGHWATDWESHWQQTPGQTDQSEGSAGLKGVGGRT